MDYKRFLILLVIPQILSLASYAQDQVMRDVATFMPTVSTKQDVISKFSQGEVRENSVWLILPDKSIEFFFSNGECREDWLVPKGKLVTISIFFREERPISDLTAKVKLKGLRKTYTLDGDRLYHDDKNGIMYGVVAQGQVWSSMTYYPSKKFSHLKC